MQSCPSSVDYYKAISRWLECGRGEMQRTTLERSHPMGDKKGKKDKAKGQRQKEAKQAKATKQE